ncbi:MAG: flagellin [Pseudomonadota bacterium]
MVSLLTNESAMVALSTLRMVNNNLNQVQAEISTGKSIGSARDNAAIWAVSTVMESDVEGFKAISESLDLGSSTVAVARSASEQVTDLLVEIKGLVVAAQEDNVDRSKIQTDIGQLRGQIGSIVGAAQFNGLNLLQGTESVDILSSLDRASDQTVSDSKISVSRSDLSTSSGTFSSAGDDLASVAITGTPDTAVNSTARTSEITLDLGTDNAAEIGSTFGFSIDAAGLTEPIDILTTPAAGGETREQIADALVDSFNAAKAARPTTLANVTLAKTDLGGGDFSVTLTNSDPFTDLTVTSLTGNAVAAPATPGTPANDDAAVTVTGVGAAATVSLNLGADNTAEAGSTFALDFTDAAGPTTINFVSTAAPADETEADALTRITNELNTFLTNAGGEFAEITASVNGTDIEFADSDAGGASAFTVVAAAGAPAAEAPTPGNAAEDDAQLTVGTAALDARASVIELTDRTVNEGDAYRISYQGVNIDYVARNGDTVDDVGDGLRASLEILKDTDPDLADVNIQVDKSGSNTQLQIDDGAAGGTLSVQVRDGGTAAGGLVKLGAFDVSTAEGAADALQDIEDLIQTGIDAAAAFGSAQRRIDIQGEFVTSLMDSLKGGIGALTDADMEEASARLQSLQVQQQLGIQALSIANQQPQALLSLFR